MFNTDNKITQQRVALGSVIVIGVLAFWGGFTRRWMSDDGLIVLRTVRNLEAGNGPVFNVGERVEANTSTLWQYLIYIVRVITGAPLEGIAIWLGLLLSVAALVVGTWATATRLGRGHIVLPAGALVYIAISPARDFFTSGLEWGLSIFYLAMLWLLLLRWGDSNRYSTDWSPYILAFWAGLSWLIRPELALYGGLTGILLLAAHRNWRQWLGIFGAALPVPLAYQIFRMGYYGLLTPHTAVAKSASESAWGSGWNYLVDLAQPYALYLPLIALVAAGMWVVPQKLRSMPTVTYLLIGAGVLHTLYVLRVGGDFMHGRMLLLPLFAILLPFFVLPWRNWITAVASAFCAVWAVAVVLFSSPYEDQDYDQELAVVDERDFWTEITFREEGDAPKTAEDFLPALSMNGYPEAVEKLDAGDAFATRYLENEEPKTFNWWTSMPAEGTTEPPTLYFMNLGMTSMNAPLNVRVLDPIGLATPMAARQPRLEDGRIGHDKFLPIEWWYADSGTDPDDIPAWVDDDKVEAAREALQQPQFQELFASYRDPLTAGRFWENIKFSLTEGRTLTLLADPYDYLR
ncbi:hypothetical protein [Corynebacterium camporealensis]